jgi:hypothetical protein
VQDDPRSGQPKTQRICKCEEYKPWWTQKIRCYLEVLKRLRESKRF